MNEKQVLNALTDKTRAVFLTHILGFNGLSSRLIEELEKRNIPLIEDVCESHGATFQGKRLGSIGYASNFSFYFAHHMSTIEGGMVSTNDERFYNVVKILRSHGMTRELDSAEMKAEYFKNYPDLNPDFIFAYPGYNMRSTELNAVIGRRQLKSLDTNNEKRVENCRRFYDQLDKAKFRTDFEFEGSVNYAFVLVLRDPDQGLMDRLCARLKECNVEFRRGTSGGGNQLRQPYLKGAYKDRLHEFPEVDHLHFFGMYIGNYPTLETSKIDLLCRAINSI